MSRKVFVFKNTQTDDWEVEETTYEDNVNRVEDSVWLMDEDDVNEIVEQAQKEGIRVTRTKKQ